MRPRAGLGQGDTRRQAGKKQTGTPCRVRLDIYLVGYGREGRREERQRGDSIGGGQKRETEKEETQAASRRDDLPTSAIGEGVGVACLLKRQNKSLHSHLFFIIEGWEVRHHRLKELGRQILRTASCFFCGCLLCGGDLIRLDAGHILA